MKALIIYDSVFRNTEKVAQAVGQALAERGEVSVVRVSDVKPGQLSGLDLLVVSSPTRGFQPTPALAEFLKALPEGGLKGVRVAVFDTRIPVKEMKNPLLRWFLHKMGYAAPVIAKTLAAKGAQMTLAPEGFFVEDREGPLRAGELDRAAAWIKTAL